MCNLQCFRIKSYCVYVFNYVIIRKQVSCLSTSNNLQANFIIIINNLFKDVIPFRADKEPDNQY